MTVDALSTAAWMSGANAPPTQHQPLAGWTDLLRFMLRRDRFRAPVWILSIVGVIAASTASIVGLYDSPEDLQEYAALAQLDPALKAIAGPGHGLDDPTLGSVVMNETLIYTFIIVALMCAFTMTRHTRAEEETDRAELVRAAAIGRLSTLAAACVWTTALNTATAIGLTLSLLAFDLDPTGSLAFGLANWAIGMAFIGVTATTAQVASSARTATSSAGALLGASFVLRAVGDLGTEWAIWTSPLGWAQSIRAFADERWWVLIPLLGTALTFTAGAAWLSARRDLGAGLMKQRPGPADGSPLLASPLALAARLQRTSLISWAVGLGALGFFFGIVADQAEAMLESEAIAEFFEQAGVGTPTELFLATMILMVALTASGFTVATVLRLRTEELSVRAEPVLATPVSRIRWSLSYVAVSLGGTVVVMLASGLAIGLGSAAQLGDANHVLPILAASATMVPAHAVLAGVALVLIGWVPRRSSLAWIGVAVIAVVGLLAETLKLPQGVRDLSPFEHVPPLPAASFEAVPIALLGLVAALLITIGLAGMNRRDIG